MEATELGIEGAFVFTPVVHADDRGSFLEWFRADVFQQAVGHPLHIAQANASISAAGTIRGIHFAEFPPSQAKYVTCTRGEVLDVVVDLRVGSATFGRWEAVSLDDRARKAVYLSEGLGHGFMAVQDRSVVTYLCSAPYAPEREHAINPLDEDLDIAWPEIDLEGRSLERRLSTRDAEAPGFNQALPLGVLPSMEDARSWLASLRASGSQ